MATQGLFQLLGESPQEVRRKYEAGLMLSPQEMGQQGLLQQVISTIAQGGTGFGYGLGRMLGAKAPGEAEAEAQQAALLEAQQSGLSGSALYKRLADISADPRRAFVLRQQAAEMAAAEAKAAQEEELRGYQLKKARFEADEITDAPVRRRAALEAKFPTLDEKQIISVANNKELFQTYMTPTKPGETEIKKVGVAEGTQKPVYVFKQGGNVSQVVAETDAQGSQSFVPYSGAVDQTTAKQTVTVGDKGQDEQLKTFGKLLGESQFNLITVGVPRAKAKIAVIDQTIDLLEEGKAVTGFAADLRNDVERIKSTVFGDAKAAEKASASQLLNAFLGGEVFSLIGELGVGARGLDTPAERDFLREVFTGTRALEPEALLRLAKMRRRAQEIVIQRYNNALQQGQFNRYQKRFNLNLQPEQIPTRTSSKWEG